ncbi:MAG: hypothetical protein Q9210_005667 [Variospora velana]
MQRTPFAGPPQASSASCRARKGCILWSLRIVSMALGQSTDNARRTMYRVAPNIYLTLINDDTANYAINIEGHIRKELHSLFRAAAISIAFRRPSTSQSPNFQVTPWDEGPNPFTNPGNDHCLRSLTRHSDTGSSSSSTSSNTNPMPVIDMSDASDPSQTHATTTSVPSPPTPSTEAAT